MSRAAIIVVLVACGSQPAPRPMPPEIPPAAISLAHSTCTSLVPDTSDDTLAGIELVAPPTAELACDQWRRTCSVHVPVTITNCRSLAISIDGLVPWLDGPPTTLDDIDPDRVIRPGASTLYTVAIFGEGAVELPFKITSTSYPIRMMSGGRSWIDRTQPRSMVTSIGPEVHVTNPARDAAIHACDACNGDWGQHGMIVSIKIGAGVDQGETCRCRTADDGKRCRDGDQCQGWCEQDGFEVVGRGGIGYPTGHCSEFTDQRSCVHPIDNGASREPPGPNVFHEICID